MGSLAAILNSSGRPDEATVRRMLAAAPHRGSPDEVVVQGRCALGIANRQDLPNAAIATEDGVAAAFVGTLDNMGELANRLGGPRTLDPITPATVLASAFRRWGEDTLTELRGMFAAVVTDGRSMWAFRDHMALGQLCWRQEPQALYVASEAKQVVAGSSVSAEPDMEVVERIFWLEIDENLPSALRGVHRLPKASILVSDGDRPMPRRYWDPSSLLETARLTPEEISSRFDELLTQAVGRMLSGQDVVSLSGGIDSPGVAGYAAPVHLERFGRSLPALSKIFPDYPTVDEREYIEAAAEYIQMPLHMFKPEARPLDDVVRWARLCDGPIPVLPPAQAEEYYREAKALGFRNILTGEFAETVYDRREHVVPHLLMRGRLPTVWKHLRDQRVRGYSLVALGRQLASAFVPAPLLSAYARHRRVRVDDTWFVDWLDHGRIRATLVDDSPATRRRWRRYQLVTFYGSPIALEADETCQVASGVRVRRPYGDVDVIEFMLSLPAHLKFPDHRSKSLARSLLRGRVPDLILDRTDKTAFNDFFMSRIDWETMRRLLVNPKHRIGGVNYDILADRLDRQDLTIPDYKWALDLAKCHAFLSLWE
jgi:asparagine synthase (glutamine-hydrolysing)